MFKRLILLSSVAVLGSYPVWAQEQNQPSPEPTPLPAPTEQVEPPAMEPTPQDQVPSNDAIGEITPDEPATPPPAEAIIPAQAANEVRADTLIGMGVFNADGEKVGEVKDILLDNSGKVTGVVLSVGGVLGLGAKSVGLNWSEVDVQPEAQVVKVQYSKEQLEAAPDFVTQETQRAETESQILQQEEPPAATGTVPPAQPAPDATQ